MKQNFVRGGNGSYFDAKGFCVFHAEMFKFCDKDIDVQDYEGNAFYSLITSEILKDGGVQAWLFNSSWLVSNLIKED